LINWFECFLFKLNFIHGKHTFKCFQNSCLLKYYFCFILVYIILWILEVNFKKKKLEIKSWYPRQNDFFNIFLSLTCNSVLGQCEKGLCFRIFVWNHCTKILILFVNSEISKIHKFYNLRKSVFSLKTSILVS